jgi:hypothetical protein
MQSCTRNMFWGINASTVENKTTEQVLREARSSRDSVGWQVLWFMLHVAAVYAITLYCTPWLAGWTRGKLLPLLQQPTTLSGFEFLYSHIFAFSFLPAFAVGLVNARFRHSVAHFVWLVPTVVLAYKFFTFPAPSVLQSQFQVAFHQYFGGGFQIPEFRDWREFWQIVMTNPDMLRGKAQLDFTAPFYAGIGYSVAAWMGERTNLSQKVSEGVKNWENSRFENRL